MPYHLTSSVPYLDEGIKKQFENVVYILYNKENYNRMCNEVLKCSGIASKRQSLKFINFFDTTIVNFREKSVNQNSN